MVDEAKVVDILWRSRCFHPGTLVIQKGAVVRHYKMNLVVIIVDIRPGGREYVNRWCCPTS